MGGSERACGHFLRTSDIAADMRFRGGIPGAHKVSSQNMPFLTAVLAGRLRLRAVDYSVVSSAGTAFAQPAGVLSRPLRIFGGEVYFAAHGMPRRIVVPGGDGLCVSTAPLFATRLTSKSGLYEPRGLVLRVCVLFLLIAHPLLSFYL